jgi:DNA-binding CsgD family transcriptional regulator
VEKSYQNLTPRQMQLWARSSEQDKQVARDLAVTYGYVRNQRHRICQKLQVTSTKEAAVVYEQWRRGEIA